MTKTTIILCIALCSTPSYAQFGNLLKDLKSAAEAVKNASEALTQESQAENPKQSNPVVAPTVQQSSQPQQIKKNESTQANLTDKQSAPPSPILEFRNKWCKSTDNLTLSPIEYRNLRTGDICNFTDEIILGILKKFENNQIDINSYQDPTSFQLDWIIGGESQFTNLNVVLLPKSNKFYIPYFAALICPSSEFNSLVESNSFRVALEQKYGKPSGAFTEYDVVKQQVDEVEKMIAQQKKSAITVAEMQSVREGEQSVNVLKNLLANANKNLPMQLGWKYDNSNIASDEVGMLVDVISSNSLLHGMRCPENYNSVFRIHLNPSLKLNQLFANETEKARLDSITKQKNAPVPKL